MLTKVSMPLLKNDNPYGKGNKGGKTMAGQYNEPYEKLSKRTKEVHRAYVSLIEEIEAMDWYQQRIDVTEDESLKKILEHNRDEEKEHASMLLEWIRRNDEVLAKELKANLFQTK
jgi:hypothetical protein